MSGVSPLSFYHCRPIGGSAISYPESSGFLVSGATPGRLWGHQILLPQDFCGKTIETVTEQPIKKIEFFRCPQSLPGAAPLTKKPEDSGNEIGGSEELERCICGPRLRGYAAPSLVLRRTAYALFLIRTSNSVAEPETKLIVLTFSCSEPETFFV